MARLRSYPEPVYIDGVTKWRVTAVPRISGRGGAYAYDVLERILIRTYDRVERVRGTIVGRQPAHYEEEVHRAFFGPDAWAVHGIGRREDAPPAFVPDVPNLKTIAAVVAYEKSSYRIVLDGVERLANGREAYRLELTPLTKPEMHNLREMWIDTSTYDLWRAVTSGTYALPEFGPGQARVVQNFAPFPGHHWLVGDASWSYDAPASSYIFNFALKYVNMEFPVSEPPSLFAETP